MTWVVVVDIFFGLFKWGGGGISWLGACKVGCGWWLLVF